MTNGYAASASNVVASTAASDRPANRVGSMSHDEMIAVIEAHRDGKKIQYQSRTAAESGRIRWRDCNGEPSWNFGECVYRVRPEPIHVYVNVYERERLSGSWFGSRAKADAKAEADRIACVRVEFVPGQFDD